jgi:hypothetical protein
MKYLCRPIDLDGYNTYSSILNKEELTLREIDDIIRNCSEAELREYRLEMKARTTEKIARALSEFVPPDPGIIQEHFHVVVSRYNEDPSWLKNFVYYNCSVFLYNKGTPISNSLPPNVFVFDVENVGYEDYAYVTHITKYYEYYQYNNTKIVFTQCGIDHCPNILDFLKNVDAYNKYKSLFQSMGVSEAWGEKSGWVQELIPVTRDMSDIGGGREYVDAYVNHMRIPGDDLYTHYCDYFQVSQLHKPMFSPCAVFVVPSCKVTKQDASLYFNLKYHIEHIHKYSNPIMSKIFASIVERLWYTFFI